MHPEHILLDAQYSRSRIHQWHAHRHLVEQVATADHEHRRGFRYQVGITLIAAGRRIQGAAASLPEAPSLPEPTPTPRPAR